MSELSGRYNYNFPTSIRFGKGVIDELGKHLADLGFKRPLVVSDPALIKLEVFQKAMGHLTAAGLSPEIYSGVIANGPCPVQSKLESCDQIRCDWDRDT